MASMYVTKVAICPQMIASQLDDINRFNTSIGDIMGRNGHSRLARSIESVYHVITSLQRRTHQAGKWIIRCSYTGVVDQG